MFLASVSVESCFVDVQVWEVISFSVAIWPRQLNPLLALLLKQLKIKALLALIQGALHIYYIFYMHGIKAAFCD